MKILFKAPNITKQWFFSEKICIWCLETNDHYCADFLEFTSTRWQLDFVQLEKVETHCAYTLFKSVINTDWVFTASLLQNGWVDFLVSLCYTYRRTFQIKICYSLNKDVWRTGSLLKMWYLDCSQDFLFWSGCYSAHLRLNFSTLSFITSAEQKTHIWSCSSWCWDQLHKSVVCIPKTAKCQMSDLVLMALLFHKGKFSADI